VLRVPAASCPLIDYLHIPKVLRRPLPNSSTSTNESRTHCCNVANTPPRHPQAFWLSAMEKEGKKRHVEKEKEEVLCKRGGSRCLGRISSQTAWAKFAQTGKSKQCKNDRPYEQGYWERRVIKHRIRCRNQQLISFGSDQISAY